MARTKTQPSHPTGSDGTEGNAAVGAVLPLNAPNPAIDRPVPMQQVPAIPQVPVHHQPDMPQVPVRHTPDMPQDHVHLPKPQVPVHHLPHMPQDHVHPPMPQVHALPAAISMHLVGVVLRIVVAVMTLIAAIVMGTSEEEGPRMSQLKYFIAVNTIACVYALASTTLNAIIKEPSMVSLLSTIGDVLTVSFLFSGIGSASALSVSLKTGSVDSCGAMCAQTDAAIAISSLGAFTLLALVLISIFNFHGSSN